MEIESVRDINLIGRALNRGWLDGLGDRRTQAVEALLDVVDTSGDPEMQIKAFAALVRADNADLKREEVALKKLEADENRRLRLLEFIKSLPPGEVLRIASEHRSSTEE